MVHNASNNSNYKTVINGMRKEGKNIDNLAKKLQL